MRILVVEDDFVTRKVLSTYLKDIGTCDAAANGKEAVTACKSALEDRRYYDLICLDIMMPEMDGHEALQIIRQLEQEAGLPVGRGAKVVMITALDDARNVMSAFKEQCDGYITKPFKRESLMDKLKEIGLAVNKAKPSAG